MSLHFKVADRVIVGVPDTLSVKGENNESANAYLTPVLDLRVSFYSGVILKISPDGIHCRVRLGAMLELLIETRYIYKPT